MDMPASIGTTSVAGCLQRGQSQSAAPPNGPQTAGRSASLIGGNAWQKGTAVAAVVVGRLGPDDAPTEPDLTAFGLLEELGGRVAVHDRHGAPRSAGWAGRKLGQHH